MRQFLTIVIICACTMNIAGQVSNDLIFHCDTAELDKSLEVKDVFKDMIHLNSVTLGDAGEASDPVKYLDKYHNIITRLNATFTKNKLIDIVQKNYCPLVTCYAFTAWTTNKTRLIDNKKLEEIIIKFARDTASYVILNWGCARSTIETFDYMLSLTTKTTCFGKNFSPLSKATIEKILEIRRPFFREKDFYGYKTNWETYKSRYLK